MPELPKIKVFQPFSYPYEEIYDLDQVNDFLFNYGPGVFIVAEGQVINSYDQLASLVAQVYQEDKEFIEVSVKINICGG